jgi:hypothetical protein
MVTANSDVFPSIRGLSEKDVEKMYSDYAQSFGDCEAPKDVSAHHGAWELVGQRPATNKFCGMFVGTKICDRVELHGRAHLDGEVHAGGVFVHMVHRSCNRPECSVCCFSGWAKREADKIAQRCEVASKHFGEPYHIVVSPSASEYHLAEFENAKFLAKVKKLLSDVGVVGGVMVFHGFRYADYQESIDKGMLQGWYWACHVHTISFILGGDSKCRHCVKS